MAATLPAAEARVLNKYSYDLYLSINTRVRTPTLAQSRDTLTSVFSRYTLPEAMTVYRGVDFRTLVSVSDTEIAAATAAVTRKYPGVPPVSYLVAQVMRDQARTPITLRRFTSTTASLEIAESFANDRLDADPKALVGILQLTLPAGSHAIPMVGRLTVETDEEEVLLPAGTRLRIDPAKTFFRIAPGKYGRDPLTVIPATVVSTRG